ncbi:MAG TPA: DUF4129 domain-containing protein [Chloroflexota bacterium]|nr:DUF4129 domain-containing protein [Chloroflexota bacterium]
MQAERPTASAAQQQRLQALLLGGAALIVLLAIVAASLGLAASQGRAVNGSVVTGAPAHPRLALLAIAGVAALLLVALRRLQLANAQTEEGMTGLPWRLLSIWLIVLLFCVATLIAALNFIPEQTLPPQQVGLALTPRPLPLASPTALPASTPAAVPGASPTVHVGNTIWLAAALGVAVLVVLLAGGDLLASSRRRPVPGAPATAETPLQEAIDAGIEQSLAEEDPRRAVIAAYAGMERALARHGLARRPQEAPFEYLRRVLPVSRAHAQTVRQLTELYELARFSEHPVTAPMKETALQALERIREDLARQAVAGGV